MPSATVEFPKGILSLICVSSSWRKYTGLDPSHSVNPRTGYCFLFEWNWVTITVLEGTLTLKGQENKKKWTVSTWPSDHAG